jgi:rubredoxin
MSYQNVKKFWKMRDRSFGRSEALPDCDVEMDLDKIHYVLHCRKCGFPFGPFWPELITSVTASSKLKVTMKWECPECKKHNRLKKKHYVVRKHIDY